MPAEMQRKIAMMGFPGVGKSSITQRFVSNTFPDSYDTTIEDQYQKVPSISLTSIFPNLCSRLDSTLSKEGVIGL